jgi:2-dehydropantoate 2-reductase
MGSSERLAIVGAGAMGCVFGATLAEAGLDVTLLDVSRPLVDRINEAGVTVVRDGVERTASVRTTDDPAAIGPVSAAIVFVKCYHTEAAAELMRPLVGDDSVVASLQNGWGNGDVLAAAFPPEQIAVGVTYNSGLVLEPARVVHPSEQPTFVGSFADGDTAGPSRLAQAVEDAGMEIRVVAPIRPEIWKKLILNTATLPGSALTGMTAGLFTECPDTHELVTDVARESVGVARALGYDIDAEERVATIHELLGKAGPSKGSMLQDFEAGRRTEIDVINGAVVKAADETGVEVPLNRMLVRLVKGWEATRGLS